MGCLCCSISSFVSILLDALERVSLCTVCAMLTCCLLLTILIVMVMGIGIGYHYCFVQNSAAKMGLPGNDKGKIIPSVEVMKRGFIHHISRRDADGLQSNTLNKANYTLFNRKDVFNETLSRNLTRINI